jgi:hypothetical protein
MLDAGKTAKHCKKAASGGPMTIPFTPRTVKVVDGKKGERWYGIDA